MARKSRRRTLAPSDHAPRDVEYIEVVDEGNRPLAVMGIDDVHAQTLMHRSVVVLVYNAQGKVYLQRRSASKSRFPGRWDLSATGHVTAGEAVEDAATRELAEELGITGKRLRRVGEAPPSPATGYEFVTVFSAGVVQETPVPNPDEVDGGYFVDRTELSCLIDQFRELLTPTLLHFWENNMLFSHPLEGVGPVGEPAV